MEYASSSKPEAIHTKSYLHELCRAVADWFSRLSDGKGNETTTNYGGTQLILFKGRQAWILSPYHLESNLFGMSPNQSGDDDGTGED